MTEQEYLNSYDITAFDRPSLAVDIALFSIVKDKPAENFRKLDKNALKILLIKRGEHPFKDCFALPGGFCRKYEDVEDAARRELLEETSVSDAYMTLIGAYGAAERDPRGWIVSNTFLALMDAKKCAPRAGTDAWEAEWFTVTLEKVECETAKGEVCVTNYHMDFTNAKTGEVLSCEVIRKHIIESSSERIIYEVKHSQLAFDHAKIVLNALLRLQEDIANDKSLIFNIMPNTFTMNSLQEAFELILNKPLVKANFNRDMAKYVEETGEMLTEKAHRPAKIFRRKI